MNKKLTLIIIVVLAIVGWMLFKDKKVNQAFRPEDMPKSYPLIEFTVDASNFAFAPKTLTVNKGDTVKITLNNTFGMHDLKIDEFNAKTKVLKAGESETITFVVDKSGSFEYYCSIGTHRQMGMVGQLIVN